jgi:hypothetical protein
MLVQHHGSNAHFYTIKAGRHMAAGFGLAAWL